MLGQKNKYVRTNANSFVDTVHDNHLSFIDCIQLSDHDVYLIHNDSASAFSDAKMPLGGGRGGAGGGSGSNI